jgi:hypothetical protein
MRVWAEVEDDLVLAVLVDHWGQAIAGGGRSEGTVRITIQSGRTNLLCLHLKCLQFLKQFHGLERLSQQLKVVSAQTCICQQVQRRSGAGE